MRVPNCAETASTLNGGVSCAAACESGFNAYLVAVKTHVVIMNMTDEGIERLS